MLQFTISARLRLIEVLIFNVTNTKLFVNLTVWFQLELEEESVCQKNLEYIEKLQAKDKEEREKQLKMDQETAHALQKEELEHLGDFSLFHRMHILFLFLLFYFVFLRLWLLWDEQMNVFRINNKDTSKVHNQTQDWSVE